MKFEPSKNENIDGNSISLNLLFNSATTNPTIIPPKTPTCNVGIPNIVAIIPSFAPGSNSPVLLITFPKINK